MIAGLGNPGRDYAQTRHNIGFAVLDRLAREASVQLDQKRFDAVFCKTRIAGCQTYLIKPMSYMNKSGFPIQKLAAYYKISLEDVMVVHDDMDLPFGRIKVVQSRGHGGHNGIRSIIDAFGSKDFVRVRVGVGRPEDPLNQGAKVVGHVLGHFTPEEKLSLEDVVVHAADACTLILKHGVSYAMNHVNS